MKLRDVIWLLDTDYFYIHVGERDFRKSEHIETSAKGSYAGLKKYFDHEVVQIWGEEFGLAILLKE